MCLPRENVLHGNLIQPRCKSWGILVSESKGELAKGTEENWPKIQKVEKDKWGVQEPTHRCKPVIKVTRGPHKNKKGYTQDLRHRNICWSCFWSAMDGDKISECWRIEDMENQSQRTKCPNSLSSIDCNGKKRTSGAVAGVCWWHKF